MADALPQPPPLCKTLVIDYDVLDRSIGVDYREFSTFEALGLLEAAKILVGEGWKERR